jgi:hypothetical protein
VARWFENALEPHADAFTAPVLQVMRTTRPLNEASVPLVVLLCMLLAVPAAEGVPRIPVWKSVLRGLPSSQEGPNGKPGPRDHAASTAAPRKPKDQATPQTSPEPAQTPTPMTYESVCGHGITPGYPAPETQAAALKALWLGRRGQAGAGALVAGCAQLASRVPGQPQLWMVVGMCGNEIRSLGIAGVDQPAVLLLQDVALFALAKARARKLRGASRRIGVAAGDIQIFDTIAGSYVLVRRQAASGSAGSEQDGLLCAQMSSGNSPYTIVPAGLVPLWLDLAKKSWIWPSPDASARDADRAFVFLPTLNDQIIARAQCTTDARCTMWISGRSVRSSSAAWYAAEALLRYAPAAHR